MSTFTNTVKILMSFILVGSLFANTLSLVDNGDGTWGVGYESSDAIGGFQFNVDGASINSAGGGDAAVNGFMISASSTTVLGFSLTGTTIPPGEGTLLTLDLSGVPNGLTDLVFSDDSGTAIDFSFDGGNNPLPTVSIISPADGSSFDDVMSVDVEVSPTDLGDGDHYHAFLDGASQGMFYADNFSINVGYGDHTLTVVIADGSHSEYDHEGSSDTVSFSNDEPGGDGVVGDEENSLWLVDNGDSWGVGYNSDYDIGGFQFNVDGTTINSASGGDATAAGFMVSASGTTVIGFSLTGSTIPVGSGNLLDLVLAGTPSGLSNLVISDGSGNGLDFHYDDGSSGAETCDDMDACNYGEEGDCTYAEENYDCDGNCITEVDCEGVCGGTAEIDACGICGGDGSTCPDDGVHLEFGDFTGGSVEILMTNNTPVAGFQISFSGLLITSAEGGSATENGFMMSASGSTVIGFSLSGSTIPAGEGEVLCVVNFSDSDEEFCFTEAVLSDSDGGSLDYTLGDCYSGPLSGCTDMNACNYDADAEVDDETCWYASDGCSCEDGEGVIVDDCGVCGGGNADMDCAGVCDGDAVEDCTGECNGSAAIDNCGVCAGENADMDCAGICFGDTEVDCADECGGGAAEDCTGECNGLALVDCSGECNGDAMEDACGVCEGTETDPANCVQEGYMLSFGTVDIDNGTLEIIMNNEDVVAGFQFDISGLNITSASGGSADTNGFMVSASGSTVIGFSLDGSTIPASNGVLVNVSFDSAGEEFCLSNPILSDADANQYDVNLGDCFNGFGCMDASACNYDANAVVNQGCWYASDGCSCTDPEGSIVDVCGVCGGDGPMEGYDCDGNCIVDIDCLGDCGGDAVVDDCGVCDGGNADLDCTGDCGGDAEYDCAGVCNGNSVEDICGDCNGTATDPAECVQEGFMLSFGYIDLDNGTLGIIMNNEDDVAGFQFEISGLNITGASGGSAEINGFMVSASGSTVIGFSLDGSTIPASNGVLVNVSFDSTGEEFCLSNPILSGSDAEPYDVDLGDCFNGFGCMDPTACNYDSNAVVDIGCAYESDCFDECGGVALTDDCGVCEGGNADMDCAGECFGSAEEDCAGVCNGDAVTDVCGACEGTETDPANCGCEFEVVSLGSASIDAGDSFEIPLSLCNDDPVAGIQVQFNDIPDWLDVIDVVPTPRMDGMTVSWNMQGDGSTVVVGFSLTGDQIQPGDGALVHIQYQSNSIYEAEVVLDIVESILSNDVGEEMEHDVVNGSVSIAGEELPVAPEAPTGLTAMEGEDVVELSWNASANTDTYYIYREQQSAGGTTGGGDVNCILNMFDSYGDGWNGNVWTSGNASATIDQGSEGTANFNFDFSIANNYSCDGGTWQSEVSWTLECEGTEVASGGAPASGCFGDCAGGTTDGGGDTGGGDLSCAGNCEYSAPSGCYCDSLCVEFGDCCEDACDECGYCGAAETSWNDKELYNSMHDQYGNRLTEDYIENQNISNTMNTREYILIGETDGTTFTDTDVVGGAEYCYYVVAENAVGQSSASDSACSTPYSINPVQDLGSESDYGVIHLTWTEPEGNDPEPFCGDGWCDAGETWQNCPDDCEQPAMGCEEAGGVLNWISDGWCDASNNNEFCMGTNGLYDGGDCCPGDCQDSTYECATYGGDCGDCVDPNSGDWEPGGYCADYEQSCDNAWEWDDCSSYVSTGYYSCEYVESIGYDCTYADECGFCPEACDDPEALNFGDLGECVYTCAELGDYVDDCADDDCCPAGWIGDGFADCEDQVWGCDLTCYDNDGGDCGDGGGTTGGTTGGGTADCTSCEFDWTNYGSECCDTAWDEYGIDCATLEGEYDWDCAGCSCPGDNGGTTGGGTSCADAGGLDSWISDGYCDSSNNNDSCAWDGGDCCESTCVPSTYDCDESGATWGPCYTDNCLDPNGSNDGCGGFASSNDAILPINGPLYGAAMMNHLKYLDYMNSSESSFNFESKPHLNDLEMGSSFQMRVNVLDFVNHHIMNYIDKPIHNSTHNNRDLLGYNVYRDGDFLATTTETWYDDTNVEPSVEYCYTVTAVYDEGESSAFEVCDTAPDPGDIVGLGVSDGSVDIGATTVISITMSNENEVAGFQFSLGFSPNIADIVSISVTDRTDGFSISEANGIIIGFSLTGATIEPGEGAIVTVTLQGTGWGQADACLGDVILSDTGGDLMESFAECGSLSVGGEMIEGCMDSDALNYNPDANIPCDDCCQYPTDATLTWGDVSNSSADVGMENSVEVAGFQFTVEGATITDASGGSAGANGFMMSVANNTVIGFSLTGETIDTGFGSLVELVHNGLNGGEICFVNAVISDPNGNPLSVNLGPCSGETGPPSGCMDMDACNYDAGAEVSDDSCWYPNDGCECFDGENAEVDCAGGCGGSAEEDACGECGGTETDPENCFELQHFTDLPIETGTSSLVIIQNIDGLEPGDEVGIFDSNGITNYGDCADETGNILVGAGVWTGSQLNIVGVGSVDLCDIGGVQLSGYVEGNPIQFMVWRASDDAEYDAEATYSAGTGVWGDIITSVSLLEPIFSVTQTVNLNALMMNSISFNVVPDDATVSSVFFDNDLLIASNDAGQYYAPLFDVDLIGEMDLSKGYDVFLQGMDDQSTSMEGIPMPANYMMHVNALQMNNICFIPQECMDVEAVFADHEDRILIVSDDSGAYFVPGWDVNTIGEMCPGKGYKIFLQGMDDLDFQYPSSEGLVRAETAESIFWSEYALNSVSTEYDIVKTGISHPIILTELDGMVELGDELVAYADGEVVGAVKIVDFDAPIVLSAWGSFTQYGADLPGYENGDAIDLRLWSASEGRELRLEATLDGAEYGSSPLTIGTAMAYGQDAVPTEFGLSQNYPNPFNPSTAIDFSIATEGFVSLNVYDITGRMVSTLVEGNLSTGYHSVVWDGVDNNGMSVSAGIYIYALQTETSSITRKMVFMK